MQVKDGIQLASGLVLHRADAHSASVGGIFDRVLSELVAKMRELRVDRCELGCLRAIVLFNPESKDIRAVTRVEILRESVYSTLERYCRAKYPQQSGRFAKLLLRLPALRSVALKCRDYLLISKLLPASEMDSYLSSVLRKPPLSARQSPMSNGDLASGSESNSLLGLGLSSNGGTSAQSSFSINGHEPSSFGDLSSAGSSLPNSTQPSPPHLLQQQILQAQYTFGNSNNTQQQHRQQAIPASLKSPVDGNNNQINSNRFGQLNFGNIAGPLDGLNLLAGSAANSPLLGTTTNDTLNHGTNNGHSSLRVPNGHAIGPSLGSRNSPVVHSNSFQSESSGSLNRNSYSSSNGFVPSLSLNGSASGPGSSANNAFLISETQSPLTL